MSEKAENFTLTTTRELAAWMRRNHFFAVTAHEDPDGKSHEHMAWMLDRVNLDDMNLSKANRWIGYVQAYLVINKLCSLEDVKKDEKPRHRLELLLEPGYDLLDRSHLPNL